jgi:hypothetical protein
LFAFTYKHYIFKEIGADQDPKALSNPDIYDSLREYARLKIPNEAIRLTEVNKEYKLCPTYPEVLAVPAQISDGQLQEVAAFRSRGRIPVIVWRHPENGSTISRCSQPNVGLKRHSCQEDVFMLSLLRNQQSSLHILDSRPKTNAMANSLKGGGYEPASVYKDCHPVEFQNIENIHAVRNSLLKLYKVLLLFFINTL